MAEHQRNIYYDHWAERFEFHKQLPYAPITADWVQLDWLLNKSGRLAERMTLDNWSRGVDNYLASEIGKHTLKHLCSDFVTFWYGPLDRYGKPREKASQVGGEQSQSGYAVWHGRFLYAADELIQRRKDVWDAIEVLYDEVSQGLSEHEAFRRLKELNVADVVTAETEQIKGEVTRE